MSSSILPGLVDIVGVAHVLRGEPCSPYDIDERRLFQGRALAVVRPATVGEVARVVSLCAAQRVPMVPHGGNTGYCGGATADPSGTQLVISLERLNRIHAVDARAYTLTMDAGVVLADAQAAAAAQQCLLPLAMGSQGSCQIGGNLSTNAGGLTVLKYGSSRDLTLGLQVVLPDGRVLDHLSTLRKDNTGYDLKQLFIGAEGSLGIITAAVLKLYPGSMRQCAWLVLAKAELALDLLAVLRAKSQDGVTSFEYMGGAALALMASATPTLKAPLAGDHHVLVEMLAQEGDDRLDQALTQAHESGLLEDVVVAQNETQRGQLWRLRESIPAAEKILGGSIKHDISVPLAQVADYIARATAMLAARWPGARPSVYGHVGDGNVHFNVLAPAADDPAAFKARHGEAISDVLHDLAHGMAGSFSAEHGVGVLKRDLLARYADPIALTLMRQLKSSIDPFNLMNPGKLIPPV